MSSSFWSFVTGDTEEGSPPEVESQSQPEESSSSSASSSLWGFVNTIKQKSEQLIDDVHKDFTEFSQSLALEAKEIWKQDDLKDQKSSTPASVPGTPQQGPASAPTDDGVMDTITNKFERIGDQVEHFSDKVWETTMHILPTVFGMSGPGIGTEVASPPVSSSASTSASAPGVRSSASTPHLSSATSSLPNTLLPLALQQSKLDILQASRTTYTSDPEGDLEEEWSKFQNDFSVDSQTEIHSLLGVSAIRNLHEELVPKTVSNEQFWSRYFFRVKQLENEERRRRVLLQRLSSDAKSAPEEEEPEEPEFNWDEEETSTATNASQQDSNVSSTESGSEAESESESPAIIAVTSSMESLASVPSPSSVDSSPEAVPSPSETDNKQHVEEQDKQQDASHSVPSASSTSTPAPPLQATEPGSSDEEDWPTDDTDHESETTLTPPIKSTSTATTSTAPASTTQSDVRSLPGSSHVSDSEDGWDVWE